LLIGGIATCLRTEERLSVQRKAWVLTKDGKDARGARIRARPKGDFVPLTLDEVSRGKRTWILTDKDFYRRHELGPGEAYLFVGDDTGMSRVPEQ
jgi:hypothetical protein